MDFVSGVSVSNHAFIMGVTYWEEVLTAKHLNVKQIAFILTVMSWGIICTEEEEFVLKKKCCIFAKNLHLITKMSESLFIKALAFDS